MKIPNLPTLPAGVPRAAGPGRNGITARPPVIGTGMLRLEVVQADERMLTLIGPDGLRLKAAQPDPPLPPGTLVSARMLRDGDQPLLEIRPRLEIALLRRHLRELPPPHAVRPRDALLFLALIPRLPRLAGLLPTQARATLEHFLAGLPEPGDLASPEGLRRAMRDSGQFLEARIAAALAGPHRNASNDAAALRGDLGLLLRRLAAALRALPDASGSVARPAASPNARVASASSLAQLIPLLTPEEFERLPPSLRAQIRTLLGQGESEAGVHGREAVKPGEPQATVLRRLLLDAVETLLARQHQHQLQHVEQRDRGQQEWHVEIPLRRDDLVEPMRLIIRRDERDGNADRPDGARTWRVRLDLTLPVLGRLVADVSLDAGNAVEVHFVTPGEATRRTLHAALPRLGERLEALGLAPRAMSVRRGTVPADAEFATPSNRILDEQA